MSKCNHVGTIRTITWRNGVEFMHRCDACGGSLLGPSNDDIHFAEFAAARFAKSDRYWDAIEGINEGAFEWDPTKPIAYQWPWNGHPTREASDAHNAAGDAQIEALIHEQTRHDVAASVVRHDAFAPVDTASIEPWHASPETQDSSDHVETNIVKVESEYAETIGAVRLLGALAEPSPGWEGRVLDEVDEKFDNTDGEP